MISDLLITLSSKSPIRMHHLISPVSLLPVNLVHIVYLGICLLGLALVSGNQRISSLRILLSLVALLMTFNLLEETGISRNLHLVTPALLLGFGPVFYWFCNQLVYNKTPGNRQMAMHLSPIFLALPLTHWPQAVIALGSISQIIYLSLAIHLLHRYHKVVKQTSSNVPDISLHWMTGLIALFLVMMLQDLIRLNLQPFLALEQLQFWYFINISIYTALTSYLLIMSVRQPQLFNQFSEFEYLSDSPQPEKVIDNTNAQSLFQEVNRIILDRRLYQHPRLSLRELSTETGVQEKTLSWIINQGAGKNFSEYINQLRVDAACSQLMKLQSGNLLDTAYAVGFSSKSTFNAAFKKQTGMTPSQFCKKQQDYKAIQGAES